MRTLTRRSTPPAEPNPFLPAAPPAPVDPTETETDPLFGDLVTLSGPPQPLGIDVTADELTALPLRAVTATPLLWVVALHGGCGATTVAALLGDDALEAGRCWPVPDRHVHPNRYTPQEPAIAAAPVLLVARTHAAGLQAAQTAARAWASGQLDVPLLGLALVDDGPKLPKALAAGCAQVAGMTPHCWHLAWRESWRQQLRPDPTSLPFRVRRTVSAIRTRASTARVTTSRGPAA